MKQASQENSNHAAFDSPWDRFRKWFKFESQRLKELSYEMAQQNFSDQLKAFKDQVLSHWDKKEILLLENAPLKEHQPSESTEPGSDSHPLTTAPEKEIATKEVVESEDTAEYYEQHATSEDTPATSLVMQTLEELKKENALIHARLDKQEDTNKEIRDILDKQEDSTKEIKDILGKHEELSSQIKSLLEALFTRLPPPS